jgi:hypothetical protein
MNKRKQMSWLKVKESREVGRAGGAMPHLDHLIDDQCHPFLFRLNDGGRA